MNTITGWLVRHAVLFVTVVLVPALSWADPITLDSVSRGSIDQTGIFQTGGAGTAYGNYVTGVLGGSRYFDAWEDRSFFVFDLTGLTEPVVSATMSFDISAMGFRFAQTFSLFDFDGSIAALPAQLGGYAAFADLGSGMSFGSLRPVIDRDDIGRMVDTVNTLTLNAD